MKDNMNVSDSVTYINRRGHSTGVVLEVGKRKVKIKNVITGDIVWKDKEDVTVVTDASEKHWILRGLKNELHK